MPNPKPIERKTISDAQLHSELLQLFESGNTSKAKCSEVLRSRFKLMLQRFYKRYDLAYKEWQETRKKADSIQIQANAKEALKTALKSKIERVLFYQNEIETMEKQLKGEVEFTFKVGNKINKSHNSGVFMLPIDEQNKIRQVIKDYQSEISKMEGDYAPTSQSITHSKAEEVKELPKWLI